jgi:hypothetical protein
MACPPVGCGAGTRVIALPVDIFKAYGVDPDSDLGDLLRLGFRNSWPRQGTGRGGHPVTYAYQLEKTNEV